MPIVWPVRVSDALASASRAMPKSVSLAAPSGVTSTLEGLTSRCTMPLRVRVGEPVGHLRGQRRRGPPGAGRSAASDASIVRPSTSSRASQGLPSLDTGVEHRHDGAVVEAGEQAGLAREPLGIDVVEVAQDLDRDVAVEHLVVGPVDVGHAAAADALDEPVALRDRCGGAGHTADAAQASRRQTHPMGDCQEATKVRSTSSACSQAVRNAGCSRRSPTSAHGTQTWPSLSERSRSASSSSGRTRARTVS